MNKAPWYSANPCNASAKNQVSPDEEIRNEWGQIDSWISQTFSETNDNCSEHSENGRDTDHNMKMRYDKIGIV